MLTGAFPFVCRCLARPSPQQLWQASGGYINSITWLMPWESGSILILTLARSEGAGVTSGVLPSIFMLGAGICSGAGSAAGTCSHSGMGSELQQAQSGQHSLEHKDAYSDPGGTCEQYMHPACLFRQTANFAQAPTPEAAFGYAPQQAGATAFTVC